LDTIVPAGLAQYGRKMAELTENGFDATEIEKAVLLQVVDRHWMDHIDAMDELRGSVGLRAYGQKDPVMEYKFEGFEMFETMVNSIQEDTLNMMFHLSPKRQAPQRAEAPTEIRAVHQNVTATGSGEAPVKTPARSDKVVGRNDPCPCGSGKKYKNCCGKKAQQV
ncbi:MAG: SEC-C metal-binding domain-containing protein, partial [Eubacteriales bacterium]|nr:SEC-C metal-binding domain-containing protein [Eubacteriales bacterium]